MSSQKQKKIVQDEARDEANKRRFVDQSGVEAHDLPGHGRPSGYNDTVTDIARRNLPQEHGGAMTENDKNDMTSGSDGGLRGSRDFSDEERMSGGGRGKN